MYKLTNQDLVIRQEDGAAIPINPGNRDYQVYLEWVRDGGVALPADPVHYEQSISPQQTMPVAGNPVDIEFRSEPITTFDVLIDSVIHEITTDVDGLAIVEFIPEDVGVYIIKGSITSPLAAIAAKIEAV